MGRGRFRDHIDAMTALVENHLAVGQREECPIAAGADIFAGDELGAALADENAAGADNMPAKFLHAESFADAVATITDAALTFLMCHKLILTL